MLNSKVFRIALVSAALLAADGFVEARQADLRKKKSEQERISMKSTLDAEKRADMKLWELENKVMKGPKSDKFLGGKKDGSESSVLSSPRSDAAHFPKIAELMDSIGGGYAWRSYEVITNDGYRLNVFRIIGSHRAKTRAKLYPQNKGPLLLVHGFSSDAETWFDRSDESALAVGSQLFEEGYDVWMANMRGSMYSRAHVSLDPDNDDAEFWDFGLSEPAERDLPAIIKKIHAVSTTCKKVTIVAHSLGTNHTINSLSKATNA